MLVVILTGFVNSINTAHLTACGFAAVLSVTGHRTHVSSPSVGPGHGDDAIIPGAVIGDLRIW